MLSAPALTRSRRAILAACLLGAAVPAHANNEEALRELAAQAFFHVDVTGTPRLEGHPLHAAERSGKAFAVGPNLLVTASHVLGGTEEWKLSDFDNPVLARAIAPLEREIRVRNALDAQPFEGAVVVEAPSATINAAGLRLTTRALAAHFDLSFCPIQTDNDYWVLMGGGAPDEGASVDDPQIVPLVPLEPGSGSLGGLYIFALGGDTPPPMTTWGHDGSPILDAESNVVALVSAYTELDGEPRILATPVQPLIPGSLRQLAQELDEEPQQVRRIRCSMGDTVKRINDNLNTHSVWNVSLERRVDPETQTVQSTGNILIEYENVASAPNVEKLVVVYEVQGKRSLDGDNVGTLAVPRRVLPRREDIIESEFELHIDPVSANERKFVLGGMDDLLALYEEELQFARSPGFIQEIVLLIYPWYKGKTEPEARSIKRRISYFEFR